MTYSRNSLWTEPDANGIDGPAMDAWLNTIVLRLYSKPFSLSASLAQTFALMSPLSRSAIDTTIMVARPSLNALVDAYVVRSNEHFKVFRTIIRTVAVSMMNVFVRCKQSAKHLFSNKTMLINASFPAWVINDHVSHGSTTRPRVVVRFLAAISNVAARPRAIARLILSRTLDHERLRTLFTMRNDPILRSSPLAFSRTVHTAPLTNSCRGLVEWQAAQPANALNNGDLLAFARTERSAWRFAWSNRKDTLACGAGKIDRHRMLLTSGVTAGAVPSSARLLDASILPSTWGKEAS